MYKVISEWYFLMFELDGWRSETWGVIVDEMCRVNSVKVTGGDNWDEREVISKLTNIYLIIPEFEDIVATF